ncbi:trifunctional class I SAM-dependent methyltransferase/NUDIX hydrolase/VOC family protein [Streptomyces sp. G45]|uniref:trifunctional class I SAM-dependent methyltransferase/NUDIX hydrolase/VOC family protein n=1 Tax=Streptomyces sp. G45 TaxID=3406627 RepID=UPI003C235744
MTIGEGEGEGADMAYDEGAAYDDGGAVREGGAVRGGIDWDARAAAFDDAPDHGLRDPAVRRAWADRLADWLPDVPGDILDVGCGTGGLALLAAEQGHRVTALDQSPAMAARARAKLAGHRARVLVGDAARPPVGERRFDAVLARHVLWLLPDPDAALRHWCSLLRPGGRLVLVEGVWGEASPTGLPAARVTAALAPLVARTHSERLSADARLWGRPVDDERYALVGVTAAAARHTEVVDVHLILRRGDDVLLTRRAGTGYADGLLHLPSGHVEDGEDVRTAMIREAREELGLALAPGDLRAALVMQHRGPGGHPRTGWFFEAPHGAGGTPRNAEPHKCAELAWHPVRALPDDMVAYCRAGLDAWHRGEPFAVHWQRDGDAVAYEPTGPDRTAALAPSRAGALHHVELWVPDLAAAEPAWGWLLGALGYARDQVWERGRSWRRGDAYVVLEQSSDLRPGPHDRRAPGLNHLAFHVGGRTALDRLVALAPAHGWTPLFADRYPYAGGAAHRAAYLEDGQGYEVELVAWD